MNNPRWFPAPFLGLLLLFFVSNVFGQNVDSLAASLSTQFQPISTASVSSALTLPKTAKSKFSNPTVRRFKNGCSASNLDSARFAGGISADQRLSFCRAFQTVSDELNNNDWSPELRADLEKIWQVFLNQNVKIRPMRRGIPKQIALAAEPFTRGGGYGFYASVYIRPKFAKKKVFFLLAMHELRHIYDFYKLWETGGALPEGELEKRGFRIMGRIARETRQKEKFSRLPKLWKDSWSMYSQSKIDSKMETTIVKFMKRSPFYKARLKEPNRFMISYANRRRPNRRSQQASLRKPKTDRSSGSGLKTSAVRNKPSKNHVAKTALDNKSSASAKTMGKGVRLPDHAKHKVSKSEVEPAILKGPFGIAKAKNKKSSKDLLRAAISNEKRLYYKMDKIAYDEAFQLQCWKKQKVTDRYSRNRTVARTAQGKPVFQNESIAKVFKKKNSLVPSCLTSFEAIDSDVTETFWSAAYLEDMPIKFAYFTKLNGKDVARYTVYRPALAKFNEIAAKYPQIKRFRVFVGTIFISVEDSQIVKFWGSSFPEVDTTGVKSNKTLANYNSTAIRQRLENGIWVTASLSTVAVSRKRGKMKPFRYAVSYKNYRKASH